MPGEHLTDCQVRRYVNATQIADGCARYVTSGTSTMFGSTTCRPPPGAALAASGRPSANGAGDRPPAVAHRPLVASSRPLRHRFSHLDCRSVLILIVALQRGDRFGIKAQSAANCQQATRSVG